MTERSKPWYFVEDGARRGPVTRTELEELIADRVVAHEDLVWTRGLDGWTPVTEVDALSGAVPPSPPPLPNASGDPTASLESRVSAAHRSHRLKVSDSPGNEPLPPAAPPSTGVDEDEIGSDAAGSAGPARGDSAAVTEEPEEPVDARQDDEVHPWRRLFARHLDYLLWALPGGFAVAVVLAAYFPETYRQALQWSDQMWGFAAVAAWVPVEAFLLSWYGWTPGKWLLSVEVRPEGGRPSRYGETLKRSADVWVRGIGLGIPLVALITQLVGANKLRKKGKTSWDRAHGFDVRCGDLRAGRVVVAVVLTSLSLIAVAVLSAA
jgi:uncharacterized RDD family membrane protein YckC